ncbi:hypothetical protein A6R68_23729 [Neotoma lepida]|uniref:Uncharacterized protein n=1 Tax=Neotoma lepida TaxID=56216 RepID=A0A1A6HV02_NEOLE|nr:hypothetical protein A6R68_23729 [Neotoma lepida]
MEYVAEKDLEVFLREIGYLMQEEAGPILQQLSEGQKLEEVCGSLLYWASEILARKPYDGLADDMWSVRNIL